MRALRHAVRLPLLAALLLGAAAPAANAAEFTSTGSGDWSDPATWTGLSPGAPGATDTVVITAGHTVTLDASAPAGGLTVSATATLDLSDNGLSVAGDVTLDDAADIVSTGGQGALVVTGRLAMGAADVADTTVTIASDAGSTPSTRFDAGDTSSWSASTLSQVGGTSQLQGHTATGLAPSFDGVAVTVTGHNAFAAGLTLAASSGSGSLTFTPPAADAPGDAAQLALGSLTASGTQTVTVDWTGYAAQHGDRANLVSTTTGAPTGLTATDTAASTFTAETGLLFVRYADFTNSGAPSVSSNNTTSTAFAKPGDVVTCAPGAWTQTATYAYAWKRGTTTIAGQTASAYAVSEADLGQAITCSVTATAGHVSRGADAANTVSVPAAPSVSISAPSTVTSPSVSIAYTLGAGTTVTGCTLDAVALSACGSPVALSGYTNGGRATLVIAARNGAGQTTTATAAFDVRIAPALTIADPGTPRGGERVTLPIRTDAGAAVVCRYVGATVPCERDSVTVVAPPAGHAFTVTVTATAPGGSTTAARTFSSTSAAPLPSPIPVPVGETVTLPSASYLARGPASAGYTWHGPLRVTWVGPAADPASWGLRVTAPKTPGRSRQTLSWYADPEVLNTFTVQAFDPARAVATRAPGGVTSSRAPLTCPLGGSGTTYTWWVNGQMVAGQTRRTLPAAAVPRTAAIFCTARIAETGRIVLLRVLVDRGARLAALTFGRALAMIASENVQAEIVALRGGRPVGRQRVRLKRGTTKVPVPAGATSFTVRVVRSGGGKSQPLTVTRPS